jgi:hypothetical protein
VRHHVRKQKLMTATFSIQRRDRPWIDAYVTVVCGPFEMPSTEALRHAVTALAKHYPRSRLTWSIDRTKRRWVNNRTAASIVTERSWDERKSIGAVLDAMARDVSLDPPLTLIRYPNHLGLKMSHSIGDGAMSLTVIASVLQTATCPEVARWPAQPGGRFPLIVAGCRTFGRHPPLVRSAIRDRHRFSADASPTVTRSWTPSRRTIYTTIGRGGTQEIYSWRDEFAPTATRFALHVSLLLRALRRVGLEVASDPRVVVDLRHYLGSRLIDGNFVAGVPMRIGWQMTPEQIATTVKATIASGRPLANQMLTSLRVGTAMPLATSVDPDGPPRVTFSYFGRPPLIERLPYLPDDQPVYGGSVEPDGPWGLTFLHAENAGVTPIAAIFHDNAIDPAVMEKAMDLVASDPVGLLGETVEHL